MAKKSKFDVVAGHVEVAKELQHPQGRRDLAAGDENAIALNDYLMQKKSQEKSNAN